MQLFVTLQVIQHINSVIESSISDRLACKGESILFAHIAKIAKIAKIARLFVWLIVYIIIYLKKRIIYKKRNVKQLE